MTTVTENTEEIVGTIANLRKMCDLVLRLREDFDDKLGINQLFNDCCSAIYWRLKLHLKFHCTAVSGHEGLKITQYVIKISISFPLFPLYDQSEHSPGSHSASCVFRKFVRRPAAANFG